MINFLLSLSAQAQEASKKEKFVPVTQYCLVYAFYSVSTISKHYY